MYFIVTPSLFGLGADLTDALTHRRQIPRAWERATLEF